MTQLRRALSFSFLDRYASLVVAIASSMIIARLLTPAEIGVWSVTMGMLAYASTVRDLGAGQYLVQKKGLDSEQVRSVWTVQLGMGVFLASLVLLISGPVASFFREPRMRDIMLVVALNYVLNPFGSITYAWLVREMRFDAIAFIRFTSTAVGAIVTVTLAWDGFGPMSLAIGSVATAALMAGLSLPFHPPGMAWLPGLRGIRRVISFGSTMTSAYVLQTAVTNFPELLLGKLHGLAAAGLYSRSSGLVSMFSRMVIDVLGNVALSWFAQHARKQLPMAAPFLKATSYVSALGWSFCLGIVFLAHPMIRILYGTQWDASVDLARILAAATALSVPVALCGSALLAMGAVGKIFRATAVCSLLTVALATGGAAFGLLTLGWALVVAAGFVTAIWVRLAQQEITFGWKDYGSTLARSGLVALASAIVPAITLSTFGATPKNSLYPLIIGIPGSMLGFVIAVHACNHPLREEMIRIYRRLTGSVAPPANRPVEDRESDKPG